MFLLTLPNRYSPKWFKKVTRACEPIYPIQATYSHWCNQFRRLEIRVNCLYYSPYTGREVRAANC